MSCEKFIGTASGAQLPAIGIFISLWGYQMCDFSNKNKNISGIVCKESFLKEQASLPLFWSWLSSITYQTFFLVSALAPWQMMLRGMQVMFF